MPSLQATFRRFAIHPVDQPAVSATFQRMCDLHDEGRDHIWGYYVRNLARPVWLALPGNRVDVVVGNPPWLSYRFMTAGMQESFRAMSEERGLWEGRSVATHQDLSGLFLVRAVEQYLKVGGRFGLVMPLAALSRQQFKGLRTGRYPSSAEPVTVAFDEPWDLHKVKPAFFPVPGCVLFGQRTSGTAVGLHGQAEQWAGRLPFPNVASEQAVQYLTRASVSGPGPGAEGSPYRSRFTQGASAVPRMIFVVEADPSSPLGPGAGRTAVRSRRSSNEKKPWKELQALEGSVEVEFVRPMHVGDTVLPYRTLRPLMSIIPWDGRRLLDGDDDRLDLYPGLALWWREAEGLWNEHRTSDRLSLVEQLDFRHKLSQQLPAAPHRVVYAKGGMHMAAGVILDPNVVIDHKLYWASTTGLDEARYLTAVLNSVTLTERVRPLQARGEHNPRDFDKYVFDVPFPLYTGGEPLHARLVELARIAERVAAEVELPQGKSFQTQRRRIREALVADGVGGAIDEAVAALLR